jgi:hypothetical protein
MDNDNRKLNELLWQKKVLIKQEDRGEITQSEYEEKMRVLEAEIKPLQQEVVQSLVDKNEDKSKQMEEHKMADEKIVKEKKAKAPAGERKERTVKKFKEDTKSSMVAKALQMKSVKSIDKAVETIKTWKPDVDEKKLKSYVGLIISECKAGKGRWKAYTWDEETFQLTPKTE